MQPNKINKIYSFFKKWTSLSPVFFPEISLVCDKHPHCSRPKTFFFFQLHWVFAAALSNGGEQGLLSICSVRASRCGGFIVERGLMGSVAVAHGLRIEPVSPALAGSFPTTGPLGKSNDLILERRKLRPRRPASFPPFHPKNISINIKYKRT